MTQIETDAVLEKLHFQVEQQKELISTLEFERDEAREQLRIALEDVQHAKTHMLTREELSKLQWIVAYAYNASRELTEDPHGPSMKELGMNRLAQCNEAIEILSRVGFGIC